jgi:phospholipid/cholesterol/gamma-HCH transport system substrate-binding protein
VSRREEVGVGLLLVGGLAATAFLALQTGALSSLGDQVEVVAEADDVAGLQQGSVVSAMGVPVGKVAAIELHGDTVKVYLALRPDAEIRSDARPRIRARSLLGEKYVALDPGSRTAPLAADGDELPSIPPQYEVDELVDALGDLLRSVDPAVLSEIGRSLAEALERDPERVWRMLEDLEGLLGNARTASEDLPMLVADARATLGAARVTLGTVDARAREAQETIARADAVLAKLDAAAEPMPATVAEARLALVEARGVIEKLDGATSELDQVLTNLEAFDVERIESMLRDEGIRVRLSGRRDKH